MAYGPFDSEEPAQQAQAGTPELGAAFGDDLAQQLLLEAGRTWDVLSSDLKTDWKRG